jgi:hypothetical protein
VLAGIILENIESLRHYQTMKGRSDNIVEDILQYVSNVITSLPRHFRLPIRILVIIVGILCLIVTGHKLNSLPSEKRSRFLKRAQFIPFFTMINKLVRSLTFLRLFDSLPLESNYSNSAISKMSVSNYGKIDLCS